MSKIPLDDKDGLIITLSITRKGTGHDASCFLENKHIKNLGELKNVALQASELLWDTYDIKNV